MTTPFSWVSKSADAWPAFLIPRTAHPSAATRFGLPERHVQQPVQLVSTAPCWRTKPANCSAVFTAVIR